MDKRSPLLEHALHIPLLIGVFSALGLCVILAFMRSQAQAPAATPTLTVTPFKYALLATETPIITETLEGELLPDGSFSVPELSTPESVPDFQVLPTEDGEATPVDLSELDGASTPDPLFSQTEPLTANTYDDTESLLILNGNWQNRDELDALFETLLVSDTPGSTIAFSFVGSQMTLGYISSEDAGDMIVNVDGAEVVISLSSPSPWISETYNSGTHYVTLTHESGSTVNLDYIDIYE